MFWSFTQKCGWWQLNTINIESSNMIMSKFKIETFEKVFWKSSFSLSSFLYKIDIYGSIPELHIMRYIGIPISTEKAKFGSWVQFWIGNWASILNWTLKLTFYIHIPVHIPKCLFHFLHCSLCNCTRSVGGGVSCLQIICWQNLPEWPEPVR